MKHVTPWCAPLDHPAYAGHFPGTPIVPGVMLLDVVMRAITAQSGRALEPCEIRSLKFLSVVQPGQALAVHHHWQPDGAARFDVITDERLIASGAIVSFVPGHAA